jgi:hypothetical protein
MKKNPFEFLGISRLFVRLLALYIVLFVLVFGANRLIFSQLCWTSIIAEMALGASFFTSLQIGKHEKRCKEAVWGWTEFQFRDLHKRINKLEGKAEDDMWDDPYWRQAVYHSTWSDSIGVHAELGANMRLETNEAALKSDE